MADPRCIHCGAPLPPKERYCPACGFPAKKVSRKLRLNDHIIALVIFVLIAVAYVGYSTIAGDDSKAAGQVGAHDHGMPPIETDQFVASLPTDYASLVSMGNALMDRGQYDLAVECYGRALAQQPDSVDVRVDLGTCQHALGQNEQAIANFKAAVEQQPGHQIAKFNLGIVYFTIGDTAQAVQWWKRLLAENPSEEMRQRIEQLIHQSHGE